VSRIGVAPGPALSTLLFVPGILYGGAVRLRNRLYDRHLLPIRPLPCPAVSVGNLTVGGTGKTPLASHVAAVLLESGYRTGVISRGYRRLGGEAPLLVSDGRSLLADVAHAGDEPYLIARDNPSAGVAVGADRLAAAHLLAAACRPEALVLDDAFQHRRVERFLDLLVIDAADPWGNGRMLPFGPLREPMAAMSRAGAVVITRGNGHCPPAIRQVLDRHNPRVPLFHARIAARRFVGFDGAAIDLLALKGFSAYAFSGIARPDRFEAELTSLGVRLCGTRRFPDHHPFREADLSGLAAEARRTGAEVLVTTEKDLVRIATPIEGAPPLFALALGVDFPHGPGLNQLLLDGVAGKLGPRPTGAPQAGSRT
jgi:tetraacyldisaccharide 4'-kinase